MTIKFSPQTSLSAGRKSDPTKFKWFEVSKGKILLDNHHKEFEVELKKGEKFGIKKGRGKFILVDEDDLSLTFSLTLDDVSAILSKAKSFSGMIDGKKVMPGSPKDFAGAKSAPSASRRVPPEMSLTYYRALENVFGVLWRPFAGYINKGEGKGKPAKGMLNRMLKSAYKSAQEIKSYGGKLPKYQHSYLEKYYDFYNNTLAEVLKKPVPDILEISAPARSTYKFTVKEYREDIKYFADIFLLDEEKSTKQTQKILAQKKNDAAHGVKMLKFLGEKLPSTKKHQRVIEEVLEPATKSRASKTPSNTTKPHPGLEVKQGATPKQDRSGEAAKRITDKNVVTALKRMGVELEKDPSDKAYRGEVTPKLTREIKSAFENAGWDTSYRKGGSNTRKRGSFTVLYMELPGGKRHVTIATTGRSKGRVTVMPPTTKAAPKAAAPKAAAPKAAPAKKSASSVTNYNDYVALLERNSDELDQNGIDPAEVAPDFLRNIKGLRSFMNKKFGLKGEDAARALADDIYMGRPANLRRDEGVSDAIDNYEEEIEATFIQDVARNLRHMKKHSKAITEIKQKEIIEGMASFTCKFEGTPFQIDVVFQDVVKGKISARVSISSSTMRGSVSKRALGAKAEPEALVKRIVNFFETGGKW